MGYLNRIYPVSYRTAIIDVFQVVKASVLTARTICDSMLTAGSEFYAKYSESLFLF